MGKAPGDGQRHLRTRPQTQRGCCGLVPASGPPASVPSLGPRLLPEASVAPDSASVVGVVISEVTESPRVCLGCHSASQVGSRGSSEIGVLQTPRFRAAELTGVVVNINALESGTRQISSFANLLLIVSLIKKLLIIMFITSNNCSAIKHGLSGINGELERK